MAINDSAVKIFFLSAMTLYNVEQFFHYREHNSQWLGIKLCDYCLEASCD